MDSFNEVKSKALRTYNRCVILSNLKEDAGRGPSEDYVEQFSQEDRVDMYKMFALIKKLGVKEVQKRVREATIFEEDQVA